MPTIRMHGYRLNMNTALAVKDEGHQAAVATDLQELVEAAKPHDNGDRYLNGDELRLGLDDLIARAGRRAD